MCLIKIWIMDESLWDHFKILKTKKKGGGDSFKVLIEL